jgi:hypothetical protein
MGIFENYLVSYFRGKRERAARTRGALLRQALAELPRDTRCLPATQLLAGRRAEFRWM